MNHLLALSALFRSLSGRESSQSSIVLINFPLPQERTRKHASIIDDALVFVTELPASSESSGANKVTVTPCWFQTHYANHLFPDILPAKQTFPASRYIYTQFKAISFFKHIYVYFCVNKGLGVKLLHIVITLIAAPSSRQLQLNVL